MEILQGHVNDIAGAIQLALGPVFLLTGIAALLNVMTNRLSRIIDRGRFLTERPDLAGMFNQQKVDEELEVLEKRRHNTSRAITMCTVAALLICLVIVTLFTEEMLNIPFNRGIGILFSLAIIALVIGLTLFLKEVHLASQTIRITTDKEKQL
jgi:membrane-associated HD superfamily phosphohydrolase